MRFGIASPTKFKIPRSRFRCISGRLPSTHTRSRTSSISSGYRSKFSPFSNSMRPGPANGRRYSNDQFTASQFNPEWNQASCSPPARSFRRLSRAQISGIDSGWGHKGTQSGTMPYPAASSAVHIRTANRLAFHRSVRFSNSFSLNEIGRHSDAKGLPVGTKSLIPGGRFFR